MNNTLLKKQKIHFVKNMFCTRNLVMLVFISILSIIKTQAQVEYPSLVWAKSMGSSTAEEGRSIITDPAGNIYTTGNFSGTADFDPNAGVSNLTSVGSNDIFVSKLDASGNFVWAKAMGGTSDDIGYSIAIDAFGNIYTTGFFQATADFDPNAGVSNLTSAGVQDIFVSKLDASGNFIWAKKMGGTLGDYGYGISIDASGNVYTTGFFQDTADFDPNAGVSNFTSMGSRDIFISKLDVSGNMVWTKVMGGIIQDTGFDISVDAVGNVYTTGYFSEVVDFDPNAGVYNYSSFGATSSNDIFISKLDTSGNFLWAKRIGSNNNDAAYGISLDASGNVYTTGTFQLTADFDPNAGVSNLTSSGANDIFVSKLDTSGNFVWAKKMGGTTSDAGLAINVDTFGNVFTTGNFIGTADFDPNVGVSNLISAGSNDVFVSKLDASGNLVWAKAMGGAFSDFGNCISVDTQGNIYSIGNFTGTVDFDPNTGIYNLVSVGGQDFFIHKMSVLGAALNFDGANDIVTIGNNASYSNLGAGSFTLEAWVKPSNISGVQSIFRKEGDYCLYIDNGILKSELFPTGNGGSFYLASTTSSLITTNVWQHVVVVWIGVNCTIYINGVMASNTITTASSLSVSDLNIGGSSIFGQGFTGSIDEARIWNFALPQAQIVNNMNCELPAGQPGLVAYFQFNQGVDNVNNSAINTLTDSSGNANTGALTNFALISTTSNWVRNGGVTTGNTCSPFLSSVKFEYTSKIDVYPNPSSNIFFINSETTGTFLVYDLIGKIIKSESISMGINKIDLSNYSNGIYLMKATNDKNETKTIKLIKQ